jgi:hypothetical protein
MFKNIISQTRLVTCVQKRLNHVYSDFSPTALLTFTFLKMEKGTANEIFSHVSKEYPGTNICFSISRKI